MNTIKSALKEIGIFMLFALGLVLLLALIALVNHIAGGSFADSFWRLCAFLGGIFLLFTAVLLLASPSLEKKMAIWRKRFPHIRFSYALGLEGVVLILVSCVVNYLIS